MLLARRFAAGVVDHRLLGAHGGFLLVQSRAQRLGAQACIGKARAGGHDGGGIPQQRVEVIVADAKQRQVEILGQ